MRNGAPFKDGELPPALTAIREALGTRSGGDRQFVGILGAISVYGLEAVAKACAEALAVKAVSRDVVLNILSRTHDDPDVDACAPIEHLPALTVAPIADCRRYDALLKGGEYAAR